MGFFAEMSRQVSELYARLTISQKIAFVLLVALVVLFMVWFTDWGARPDYVPLTAQPADGSERIAAVSRLQQMGIDVRERAGVLEVSSSQLSRAMAVLAEAGVLPSDFSMLERVSGKNEGIFRDREDALFERAVLLQKFLGETIRHMEGIRKATVVFDVPSSSDRLWESKKGTASVVVWLKNKGARLGGQQVEGIASLISGALRDIPKENVRIIDGQGRPYRVRRADGVTVQVAERHEQELMYEELQAKRIQDMLSYLGQVNVFLDVDIDFNQKSTRTREVDSDNVVEVTTSSRKTSSEPVGVAGTGSSAPGTSADLGMMASGEKKSELEKTIHPEFSTTDIMLQEAPGKILDIRVTALVPREGVIEQLKREGVEVDEKASATELTPKLDEIRDCIANGLGVTDEAKVVVKAIALPKPPVPEVPQEPERLAALWTAHGTSALLGLLTLIAMFMLWRMLKRPVEVSLGTDGGGFGLGMSEEDLLADLGGPDADTLRKVKVEQKVKDMVVESPQDAAKLITRWVHTQG